MSPTISVGLLTWPIWNSGTPHWANEFLDYKWIYLDCNDVVDIPFCIDKSVNVAVVLVVWIQSPFRLFLYCNIILAVPYRSPVCWKVNALLAEVVVAVAFEHVISPVVEIAPVNAGDANVN